MVGFKHDIKLSPPELKVFYIFDKEKEGKCSMPMLPGSGVSPISLSFSPSWEGARGWGPEIKSASERRILSWKYDTKITN
jgi:hypothetical protein